MKLNPFTWRRWLPTCTLGLLLSGIPSFLFADEAADREFEFMSGLIDANLADYAKRALELLLLKQPALKERAAVIEAQILISERKFDAAEAQLKQIPAGDPRADSIRLALAGGYYAIGEIDKAQALYEAFFQKYKNRPPQDPDLLRFYQEAAYRYARMMEDAGNRKTAAEAYDMVLATAPDRQVVRRLMAEQVQLYTELAREASGGEQDKFIKRVNDLCEEIQFGGVDIWFGQAIIGQANVKLIKGDQAGATKLIDDYMDILKQIDNALKAEKADMSVSPMAGARFLRADIYQRQGEAAEKAGKREEAQGLLIKAFIDYYNVFAKYGGSDVGPDAGVRANVLKSKLEDEYGRQINVKLPQGAGKIQVSAKQFKLGDTFYREKKYEEAAAEYVAALNRFPESEHSPRVLSNLLQCYARTGDKRAAKMVAEYLGERFSDADQSAIALLLAGQYYFKEAKDEPMYMDMYETFLKYFPKHERAGGILYTLAALKKKAGDQAGRMEYLQRLIDGYKEDKYYLKALNLLAWEQFSAQDYPAAIKAFQRYVGEAQDGPDKAKGEFALADCYFRLGDYVNAAKEFTKLVSWLDPKDKNNTFNTSAEAVRENLSTLQKAMLQRANAYAAIEASPAQESALQAKALEFYDEYLQAYPDSDLASKVMAGKGRLLLIQGKFDAATATFNALASKYPETEEGKNSLFSLIKAAMEVDKVEIAKEAFSRMVADKARFGPAEFARVGNLMLEVKAYDQAAAAYEQVLGQTTERALLERSLFGLGRARLGKGDPAGAIEALTKLMDEYPKSGLFYGAMFSLAKAYRETGKFDEAVEALIGVFQFAKDEVQRNEANYELAAIYKTQGDLEGAYQALQRVVLLADPANADLHPILKKCILESVDLGMQLGHYQDVVDACDLYNRVFPRGDKLDEVRNLRRQAQEKAVLSQ